MSDERKPRKKRIRPLALCIVRRPFDGRYLMSHGHDPVKNESFYRPLGGGIKFGERSDTAARREFKEEINAELVNVKLLGFFENIFEYRGEPGHELIILYEAGFTDLTLYHQESFEFTEQSDGHVVRAVWCAMEDFNETPLYPDGLLKLLRERAQSETKVVKRW